MIDDKEWLEKHLDRAGFDLLDAMEKRLAEEFKYLAGETEKNSEADQVAARNKATRSH